ncbi:MAG: hypothetical protein CME64_03470 [Halobacteriovoraceae bacterium]|nr:hypothetical protein [Halobacteriovoraceae bacterium]|tara:strand:+ start:35472 stop:36461 length:990 start_codon:yes stop_codon:yes gene_type:complete
MNNKSDLKRANLWFLQNSKKLDLHSFKREWSLPFKEVLPKFYTCSFLTYKHKTAFGIYTSNDQLTSLTVSLIEALERIVFVEKKLENSNGCAMHTDPALCEENAVNELKERDLYMRIHFSGASVEVFDIKPDTIEHFATKELAKLGVDLKFGIMASSQEEVAVMAIADGRGACKGGFGVFLGFGVAKDLSQATAKAFNECIRFIDGFFSNDFPYAPLSFDQFSSLSKVGVDEHISLSMDYNYSSFLLEKYTANKSLKFPAPKNPKIKSYVEKVELQGMPSCPLYFSKAESDDLINPTFSNDPNHSFLKGHLPKENILKFNNKTAFHILG